MEQIVTIEEEYTLPSKGLMYAKPFDPRYKYKVEPDEDDFII